jgi:DNA polymerase-1
MPHRLVLVDGHAYAYRAYHAIRGLTAPDGQPTNAIFGFIQMLRRLVKELRPSHLAVVWDGGLSAERVAAHPSYKAQRPPMPAALPAQLDALSAYLQAARIAAFCQAGVEADDYIALAARRAAAAGLPVVIASSDKDFMQLVSPAIGLVNPGDKSLAIGSEAQVREKTGVGPEQIVDWLSLIGDTVDNIPGVRGVGPKTATQWLQHFGSVQALYGRLGEVPSQRWRTLLQAAEPAVRRNRDLIRLRDDLPCPCRLDDFRVQPADGGRLVELFQRWGFLKLAAEAQTVAANADGLLPGLT